MPTLQALKDLTDLIVADSLTQKEFLLYYNFCMSDLSEIIGYEKDMAEFSITSNINETELPADLFQIVSVVISRADGEGIYETAYEVGVNDDSSLNNIGFKNSHFDNRNHLYSRWNKKIFIKSIYLNDTVNISNELNINIKYYGGLPILDYTDLAINMAQLPPIIEQHYHYVIAHYIAYMYFTNSSQIEEMKSQYEIYLIKRNEIKDYVRKHRRNSNKNKKIKIARR